MAKGRFTYPHCTWWLRSPGGNGTSAALVRGDGSIRHIGYDVDNYYGVRHAMWINIG